MRIVADENIAEVEAAFAALGELSLLRGRQISRADLIAADVLLVRSVTRVGEALLGGTAVRYVASATSGLDHVDLDYLHARGIAFAYAPGCNATSVADYVVSSVLNVLGAQDRRTQGLTAGVVGCGHVGSHVAERFSALGIRCLLNDPPLADAGGSDRYVDLDVALDTDIVTLHVPLTEDGRYRTRLLIGPARLRRMSPGALLINTARGGVIDEVALRERLEAQPAMQAVIDCWEAEPDINRALLGRVTLGTAHIAGYSHDSKLRATDSIYRDACAFLGRPVTWAPDLNAPCGGYIVDTHDDSEAVRRAVNACYDVRADDALLRFALSMGPEHLAAYFDALRRDYRRRREFPMLKVICHERRDRLADTLERLGFTVQRVSPRRSSGGNQPKHSA